MKSVIKEYYLNQKVNLNNKSSCIAKELSQKVKQTKKLISNYFSWEGEIIFLPNPYYAKKLILENFPNHSCFTNYLDPYLFLNRKNTKVSSISEIIQETQSLIFWEGNIEKNEFKFEHLICLEQNTNKESLSQASFFLFTPIQGISIFGFKQELEPFFIGSSAISHLDRNGYSLVDGIQKFECGTGNYALLLFLYEYFSKAYLKSEWNGKGEDSSET